MKYVLDYITATIVYECDNYLLPDAVCFNQIPQCL